MKKRYLHRLWTAQRLPKTSFPLSPRHQIKKRCLHQAWAKQNVFYKIILDLEQGGARFLTNTDQGLNMMTPDEIFVKVRKNLLDLKRDRASAMKKTETN